MTRDYSRFAESDLLELRREQEENVATEEENERNALDVAKVASTILRKERLLLEEIEGAWQQYYGPDRHPIIGYIREARRVGREVSPPCDTEV